MGSSITITTGRGRSVIAPSHNPMTTLASLTTLCPSCTLSSAMRDCIACHAWSQAIKLYIPLKPVQTRQDVIKAASDDLSIKDNSVFSTIQKIQEEY